MSPELFIRDNQHQVEAAMQFCCNNLVLADLIRFFNHHQAILARQLDSSPAKPFDTCDLVGYDLEGRAAKVTPPVRQVGCVYCRHARPGCFGKTDAATTHF